MGLVEVRVSWPGHPMLSKQKKKKEKKKEKEGWRRKMGGHINIDGKDDKAIRYGDDSLEDPTSDSDDEA